MKRKYYVWLSIWLSLSLLAASCGASGNESTEEVRTLEANAIPKFSEVGKGLVEAQAKYEAEQYQREQQRIQQEAAQKAARAAQEARKRVEARSVGAAAIAEPASPTAAPNGEYLPVEYDQACGGDLPPCTVLARESGGNIRIWNRGCYAPVGWSGARSPCGGSTASGKWQFIRSTWATCNTGYLNAADAPASVQNDCARRKWAESRHHWGY